MRGPFRFGVGFYLMLVMGCEAVLSFGPYEVSEVKSMPPNLPLSSESVIEEPIDGGGASSSFPRNSFEWRTALEAARQQPEYLNDVMSYSVAGRRRYWYALNNGAYSLVSQQDDGPVVRYLFDAPLPEGSSAQKNAALKRVDIPTRPGSETPKSGLIGGGLRDSR